MKKIMLSILAIVALCSCAPPDFPDTPVVNSDFSAPETTKPNIFNTETNAPFTSVEGYTRMVEYGTDGTFNWEDLYVVPETEEETRAVPVTEEETTFEEEIIDIEIDLDEEWELFVEEYQETSTAATFTTAPPLDFSDDPEASLPLD